MNLASVTHRLRVVCVLTVLTVLLLSVPMCAEGRHGVPAATAASSSIESVFRDDCSVCTSQICDDTGKVKPHRLVTVDAREIGLSSSFGHVTCLVPVTCDQVVLSAPSDVRTATKLETCKRYSPVERKHRIDTMLIHAVDNSPWSVFTLPGIQCGTGEVIEVCLSHHARGRDLARTSLRSCTTLTALTTPASLENSPPKCLTPLTLAHAHYDAGRGSAFHPLDSECDEHEVHSPPPTPPTPPTPPRADNTTRVLMETRDGDNQASKLKVSSSPSRVSRRGRPDLRRQDDHHDKCTYKRPPPSTGGFGGKAPPPCVPRCGKRQCGGDGCGGSCGVCGHGLICVRPWYNCREPMWKHAPREGRHTVDPKNKVRTKLPVTSHDGHELASVEFIPSDMFAVHDVVEVVVTPRDAASVVPGFNTSRVLSTVADITPSVGNDNVQAYALLTFNVTFPEDLSSDNLCLAYVVDKKWVCEDREPSAVIDDQGVVTQIRGITPHFSTWAVIVPDSSTTDTAAQAPTGGAVAASGGEADGTGTSDDGGGGGGGGSNAWWIAVTIIIGAGVVLGAAVVLKRRQDSQSEIKSQRRESTAVLGSRPSSLQRMSSLSPITDEAPALKQDRSTRAASTSPSGGHGSIPQIRVSPPFDPESDDSVSDKVLDEGNVRVNQVQVEVTQTDQDVPGGTTTSSVPAATTGSAATYGASGTGGTAASNQSTGTLATSVPVQRRTNQRMNNPLAHQAPLQPQQVPFVGNVFTHPAASWSPQPRVPDTHDDSSDEDPDHESNGNNLDDFSKSLNGLIGFMSTGNAKRFSKPKKEHTVENAEASLKLSRSGSRGKASISINDILMSNSVAHTSDDEL